MARLFTFAVVFPACCASLLGPEGIIGSGCSRSRRVFAGCCAMRRRGTVTTVDNNRLLRHQLRDRTPRLDQQLQFTCRNVILSRHSYC